MDCIHSMDFPSVIFDNMSLMDDITDVSVWNSYLLSKAESRFMTERELMSLEDYILNLRYMDTAVKLSSGLPLSVPKKKLISKMGSSRKRTVYSFSEDEMMVLKVLSRLLHGYDPLFSPNLYSFRKDLSVKDAVKRMASIPDLGKKYCYKADISDYFNSIDWETARTSMEPDLGDPRLMAFLDMMLSDRRVESDGGITEEHKGAMAGIPTSAFIANHYLKDLDSSFEDSGMIYMRYSDDIILISSDREELMAGRERILSFIESKGLTVNPDKEKIVLPGETVEFLGFGFRDGKVDISDAGVEKIKAKIRRSARSIRRWMVRKDVPPEKALRVMTRKFNGKFFGDGDNGLNWAVWYFSSIDTNESLKTIDRHLQDWCRYIVTGRHTGKNRADVPYVMLKENGYITLVSEYHRFRGCSEKQRTQHPDA